MAPGTTLQTSLAASPQETAPIAAASDSHPPADLKGQDQPSSQDLDFAKLKKANEAVQKLISLAEERQSDRPFFQRASDWILRVKQPDQAQLETAKKDLQQAEKHLTKAQQNNDPKEFQKAKELEKKAFLEVQNHHSAYSDYQTDSLDRGESFYFKIGVGSTVASVIFGGAAFVLGGGAILGGASLGVRGIVSRSIALVGALGINGLGILALHRLTHPISFNGIEFVDQDLSPFDEVKREQVGEAFDILKGRISFNPGHFAIKGELLDDFSSKENLSLGFLRETIQAFQNLWDSQLDKYEGLVKAEKDSSKRVETPIMAMRADYMKLYWSAQARLTGLVQGLGGNCEARSLALASFAMKSNSIPPGWKPVAQKFHDHIQTVLYRNVPGEKEKVWDLLTGVITEGEPEAPLYDLKLFAYAYLEGEGITPSVSEESLLIRDVSWPKKVGSWIAKYAVPPSNSKLKFPSGAGWFSETPPPEKAHDLPDSYGKPLDPKPLSAEKGGTGQLSQKAFILSEITDARKRESIRKSLENNLLKFYVQPISDGEGKQISYQITFPDAEVKKRDEYRSLANDQLGKEFLLRLVNQRLSNDFISPAVGVYSAIAKDYKAIVNYPMEEVEQAVHFGFTLFNIPMEIRSNIVQDGPGFQSSGDGSADSSFDKEIQKIKDYLFSRHPMWSRIGQAQKGFLDRVKSNPDEMLYFLNALSHPHRINLIRILRTLSSPERAPETLVRLIADPTKVGIGEFKIIPYPTLVSDGPFVFQDIPRSSTKESNLNKRDSEKSTANSRIQISTECFIDFLMQGIGDDKHWRAIYKRWDSEVSKRFIQFNRDGKYDGSFKSRFKTILRARDRNLDLNGVVREVNLRAIAALKEERHKDLGEIFNIVNQRSPFLIEKD